MSCDCRKGAGTAGTRGKDYKEANFLLLGNWSMMGVGCGVGLSAEKALEVVVLTACWWGVSRDRCLDETSNGSLRGGSWSLGRGWRRKAGKGVST